eukprot:CAMPEP_0194296748 /NCGR_PEP_ID=MMETSP0169-20130528/57023_1 /TAXON_ID=218684 /ORGANISM="Corethron pennatum, Strain L29A3" /LENGTH=30 /DNA_ID= /DNA_START= /DNA_END= /DNA_ORIENTATION=
MARERAPPPSPGGNVRKSPCEVGSGANEPT